MPQAPARRDASTSPEVAGLVRLHHRRRGWAWVATGSVIGLAVYVGIDVNLFESLTGTTQTLSDIPVFVLLVLALAGLVVVIVDTSRIRRADAAARASAKGSVSHYPLYAHAQSYPPRHHGSWVFAVCMLVAMTALTVALLPAEVDSWGYALGVEHQDTFDPVAYAQSCTGIRGGGCRIVTEGYLSRTGAHATWGSQVPLGQPFAVRDPLWAWGTGRNLTGGDGSAIPNLIAGLFFDGITLLLVYVVVVVARHNREAAAAARAAPVAVHQAPSQPGRGHHGSGAHHPARQAVRQAPRRRGGRN